MRSEGWTFSELHEKIHHIKKNQRPTGIRCIRDYQRFAKQTNPGANISRLEKNTPCFRGEEEIIKLNIYHIPLERRDWLFWGRIMWVVLWDIYSDAVFRGWCLEHPWIFMHEKTSWWLNQPLWKILVKMGILPNFRGENKTYLKPPTRRRNLDLKERSSIIL